MGMPATGVTGVVTEAGPVGAAGSCSRTEVATAHLSVGATPVGDVWASAGAAKTGIATVAIATVRNKKEEGAPQRLTSFLSFRGELYRPTLLPRNCTEKIGDTGPLLLIL